MITRVKLKRILIACELDFDDDGDNIMVRASDLDLSGPDAVFDPRTNMEHLFYLIRAFELQINPLPTRSQFIDRVLEQVEKIFDELDNLYMVIKPFDTLCVGQQLLKSGDRYSRAFFFPTAKGIPKRVVQNILWRENSFIVPDETKLIKAIGF